jgi:hypothetical protein
MILSIRNVSRFAYPTIALAWFVLFIGLFAPIGFHRLGVLVPIVWLGSGVAISAAFRCPRRHGSTTTLGGKYYEPAYAPFWTPASCPTCHLDFRDKAFWSRGNRNLRADWLVISGRGTK